MDEKFDCCFRAYNSWLATTQSPSQIVIQISHNNANQWTHAKSQQQQEQCVHWLALLWDIWMNTWWEDYMVAYHELYACFRSEMGKERNAFVSCACLVLYQRLIGPAPINTLCRRFRAGICFTDWGFTLKTGKQRSNPIFRKTKLNLLCA